MSYEAMPMEQLNYLIENASNVEQITNEEYEKTIYITPIGTLTRTSVTLKEVPVEKYFELSEAEIKKYKELQNNRSEIQQYVIDELSLGSRTLGDKFALLDIFVDDRFLVVYTMGETRDVSDLLLSAIMKYYELHEVHITRMFGSYVLIARIDGKLRAQLATPIPIKYCPLMYQLLKEVGGDTASDILKSLKEGESGAAQIEQMKKLIDEVVLDGGYFDTDRPLNSCEANVLFGASETIYSAFEDELVDAAVIVSNNLGTIITTNASGTQGAVKRMTGLFYSSPNANLNETARKAGIIPVFPHTAHIDQLTGVKKAISMGYKKIAVSIAAADNVLHKRLKQLQSEFNVKIYCFGLCSTGISEETALVMKYDADIVWSCASKYVRKHIEPSAIAQVGIKIPVSVMTKDGWTLVKAHLRHMNVNVDLDAVVPMQGEYKPVFASSRDGIICIPKKEVRACIDCPTPCI